MNLAKFESATFGGGPRRASLGMVRTGAVMMATKPPGHGSTACHDNRRSLDRNFPFKGRDDQTLWGLGGRPLNELAHQKWGGHSEFLVHMDPIRDEKGARILVGQEDEKFFLFRPCSVEPVTGHAEWSVMWPYTPCTTETIQACQLILQGPTAWALRTCLVASGEVTKILGGEKVKRKKGGSWHVLPLRDLLQDGAGVVDENTGEVWSVRISLAASSNGSGPMTTVVMETKNVTPTVT